MSCIPDYRIDHTGRYYGPPSEEEYHYGADSFDPPLFLALRTNNQDELRQIDFRVRHWNGMPPLHWALKEHCDPDAIRTLIDRGIELEHKYDGQTALDRVVWELYSEDEIPGDDARLSIFRSLLRAGASATNSYRRQGWQQVTRNLIADQPQLREVFNEVQQETDEIANRVSVHFPAAATEITRFVHDYLGRPPSAGWTAPN